MPSGLAHRVLFGAHPRPFRTALGRTPASLAPRFSRVNLSTSKNSPTPHKTVGKPPSPSGPRFAPKIWSQWFIDKAYDGWVIGFNLPIVWRADPKTVLVPFFKAYFTNNHIDIGVASGYFPSMALRQESSSSPGNEHKLTLVDLHASSLAVAESRILAAAATVSPPVNIAISCVEADVTSPIPAALHARRFTSMTMFNLLHCVRGWPDKLVAFRHYAPLLADDGVFAGCTLLGAKDSIGWFTTLHLRVINALGGFDNWEDGREEIELSLRESFGEVEVWKVGQMVCWVAKKPRRGDMEHGA